MCGTLSQGWCSRMVTDGHCCVSFFLSRSFTPPRMACRSVQELQEIVEQIDAASTFAKIGGFGRLIALVAPARRSEKVRLRPLHIPAKCVHYSHLFRWSFVLWRSQQSKVFGKTAPPLPRALSITPHCNLTVVHGAVDFVRKRYIYFAYRIPPNAPRILLQLRLRAASVIATLTKNNPPAQVRWWYVCACVISSSIWCSTSSPTRTPVDVQ